MGSRIGTEHQCHRACGRLREKYLVHRAAHQGERWPIHAAVDRPRAAVVRPAERVGECDDQLEDVDGGASGCALGAAAAGALADRTERAATTRRTAEIAKIHPAIWLSLVMMAPPVSPPTAAIHGSIRVIPELSMPRSTPHHSKWRWRICRQVRRDETFRSQLPPAGLSLGSRLARPCLTFLGKAVALSRYISSDIIVDSFAARPSGCSWYGSLTATPSTAGR